MKLNDPPQIRYLIILTPTCLYAVNYAVEALTLMLMDEAIQELKK